MRGLSISSPERDAPAVATWPRREARAYGAWAIAAVIAITMVRLIWLAVQSADRASTFASAIRITQPVHRDRAEAVAEVVTAREDELREWWRAVARFRSPHVSKCRSSPRHRPPPTRFR